MTKNNDFFEKLSKKERARTAATTTTEEFSQGIQVPSSTHPGTTYPVRAIPHSDYILYTDYIRNYIGISVKNIFHNSLVNRMN